MANEQVNVQLNVGVNASAVDTFAQNLKKLSAEKINIPIDFTGDAAKVATSLGSAADQARRLSETTSESNRVLEAKNRTYQTIVKQIEAAKSVLQSQIKEEVAGSKAWKDKYNLISQANAALRQAKSELERINASLNKNKQASSEMAKAFGNIANATKQSSEGGFFDSLLGKLTLGGIAVEAFKKALEGVGDFINRGIKFEQLTLGLEAFTGSAENAQDIYASFRDTALRTPFSVPGVAEAGKTLLAFGVSIDDTKDATRRLAVIAGATGADLNNLARNLGQISAQGRAYTRDLNQFATAGIPIYQQLADVLGVSVAEVRQFAEDGKIGFNEVQQAILAMTVAGTGFSDLAARQLDTVAGQIGNLATAYDELAGEALKAFGPTIVNALKDLQGVLNAVKDNFSSVAIVVATTLAVALGAKLAPIIKAVISNIQLLVASYKAIGPATQASIAATQAQAAAIQSNSVAFNAAAKQQLLFSAAVQKQQLAIRESIVSFARYGVLIAAAATLFILLKRNSDAYQPTDAIKQDTEAAKRFSKELQTLSEKLGITSAKIQGEVSPALQALQNAYDRTTGSADLQKSATEQVLNVITFGVASWYQYNLELRKAEANSIEYGKATIAQGEASGQLLQINQALLQSNQRTTAGVQEALNVTKARITALNQDSTATKSNIEALKTLSEGRGKEAKIARINLTIAQARLSQNEAEVRALQVQLTELEKLNTAEGRYQTLLSNPTVENRTAAFEAQKKTLDDLTKAVSAVISAQETLAKAPVEELERKLKGISLEYDRQIGLLKQQKSEYDLIVSSINDIIELETRQAIGKDGRREVLELDRQILALRIQQGQQNLQGLKYGSLEYAQALRSLRVDQQALTGLDIRLKYADQLDDAETNSLNIKAQIARKELEKAGATRDVLRAIIDENYYAEQILLKLKDQKAALDKVGAAAVIAGSKIDNNINGSINDGITAAQSLAGKLQDIANTPVVIQFKTDGTRASGGPVAAGSQYTVNELGKEAFLSASGRLSMINAPAYGTWRAPSSGTVIPAHLTKMLNIPSGGVNLNNPKSANINRRVLGVSNGSNARINAALHHLGSAQQAQAEQLGKLTRAINAVNDKEWKVDLNINGNNPLLNKLRRSY